MHVRLRAVPCCAVPCRAVPCPVVPSRAACVHVWRHQSSTAIKSIDVPSWRQRSSRKLIKLVLTNRHGHPRSDEIKTCGWLRTHGCSTVRERAGMVQMGMRAFAFPPSGDAHRMPFPETARSVCFGEGRLPAFQPPSPRCQMLSPAEAETGSRPQPRSWSAFRKPSPAGQMLSPVEAETGFAAAEIGSARHPAMLGKVHSPACRRLNLASKIVAAKPELTTPAFKTGRSEGGMESSIGMVHMENVTCGAAEVVVATIAKQIVAKNQLTPTILSHAQQTKCQIPPPPSPPSQPPTPSAPPSPLLSTHQSTAQR